MSEQRTILIVDDDETFRCRLGKAFADRGFRVRLAADYAEAVASARGDPPQRAIVDLRMEGPSGLELLRELKRIDASMHIVILTGYGSIATAVEAMRLGATNYVSKPADIDDVFAAFETPAAASAERADESFRRPSLARMEWEYINRVLVECGGNVSEAARRLGMHRRTLQRKLAKYPPRESPEQSSGG